MKAQKNNNEEREFAVDDFIPYACHYSPDTILTKNGELIQFLKLDFDAGATDDEFREKVRAALNKHLDPRKYSMWIHTTRTKEQEKKLTANDYVKQMELNWRRTLPSKVHYDNCIYISILRDSSDFKLLKPNTYMRAISHKAETNHQNRILHQHNAELIQAVSNIHQDLREYGATKLSVYEEKGIHYSEPMEFLHRVLSFYDDHIPLPLADLSKFLMPEDISFSAYTGEVAIKSERGIHYGAVISLKESDRLPARSLDYLLNIDAEIVICQSLDLASASTKLPDIEYQKEISDISDDKEFAEMSGVIGIDEIKPELFALQQSNIILMQNSRKELRETLIQVQEELSRLGLVGIIEDIRIERSFWSILPGNFSFLRRQDIVAKKDIANFAILGNDIYQECDNSMFGDPVTFFESQDGEPYPFHFISNSTGHIIVVGDEEKKNQSLVNLLTLHAKKFKPRIIYYSQNDDNRNFAKEINATYTDKLDFEQWKSYAEEKPTVIVLNSIDHVLKSEGVEEEFFLNFLEYIGSNNSIVIIHAPSSKNMIKLLPMFDSQLFFETENVRELSENYDLFEDEMKIVRLLGEKNIYTKHNFEELVLRYTNDESLIDALVSGK